MPLRQKGLSLIETMVILGIVLVIAGIALPIYKNAVDTIHLHQATRVYAGVLQRAKLTAAANNTYNAVGIAILYSPGTIAYIDTVDTHTPPSPYVATEPMAVLGSVATWNQAGAPATSDLENKVFNGESLSYPPVFGSNGLPCAPTATAKSTACNNQAQDAAYATYFESPLGKWEAVTVNPAGRIQIWSYDPGTSTWNAI